MVERKLPISALHEHPMQHEFFPPELESTIEELRLDIKNRGLQEPPKVVRSSATDEWVIVSGHNRIEAVRQLGWQTVPVTVLPHTDPCDPEVITHLVNDNVVRR